MKITRRKEKSRQSLKKTGFFKYNVKLVTCDIGYFELLDNFLVLTTFLVIFKSRDWFLTGASFSSRD